MTTATTNTPIDHTTDAGFRAWGSELSGMLAAVGLVQTADTGQIDWATVTRPGTNTSAGYEVWAWVDTLQDTAPVVMKIEYGTGTTSSIPYAWLTVGTGSDGAGNITGASVDRTLIRAGRSPGSAPGSSNYPSYVCHTEGMFGLVHKAGSSTSGAASLAVVVSRPLDANGDLTAEGVCVTVLGLSSGSPAVATSVNFAVGTQYGSWSRDIAMVPMATTASLVGTDFQVIRNVAPFLRFRTLVGQLTYLRAEIATAATIDVALESVTSRTYLTLGTYAPYATNQATDGYSHAMLWQ